MNNKSFTSQPILLDDTDMDTGVRKIGDLCKIWSPIHSSLVWEATVSIDGLVFKREICEWGSGEAIRWARAKYTAIKNPQFSKSIQASIRARDYSMRDIASFCEVTENEVSNWITGESIPSIVSLVRLCEMIYTDDFKAKYIQFSKMIELESKNTGGIQ